MIERIVLGKKFPKFTIEVTEDLISGFQDLFRYDASDTALQRELPLIWPVVLTSRATACLIPVWEELGVDPLEMRLVAEEFHYSRQPEIGDELTGQVRVDDLDEIVSPDHGIAQQVTLAVDYVDSTGREVASYRCSYRLPLARPPGNRGSSA